MASRCLSHLSGCDVLMSDLPPLEDVKPMQSRSCGKPVATRKDGEQATDCGYCVQTLRFEAGQLSSLYVSLFPLTMPTVVIYI